jgi:hypothetical protein
MKKHESCQCGCGHHSGGKPLFLGILAFALGIVAWAAKAGFYSEELMVPNLFMVAGLFFTLKGIIMSIMAKQ